MIQYENGHVNWCRNQYVKIRGVEIGSGIPKICIPVTGKTDGEIIEQAQEACKAGDLLEWRADYYAKYNQPEAISGLLTIIREVIQETPLLFTFRTAAEGGERKLTPDEYEKLLQQVLESQDMLPDAEPNADRKTDGNTNPGIDQRTNLDVGQGTAGNTEGKNSRNMDRKRNQKIDLLDIELSVGEKVVQRLTAIAKRKGCAVILSSHDFQKTPTKEELMFQFRKMTQLGADIRKVAVMPQNRRDVLTLLQATEEAVSEDPEKPAVSMSMSGMGAVTRLCGEIFGSAITFGVAGAASAPGQLKATEMLSVMRLLHQAKEQDRHIFLTGFMGTGKSAVARGLGKLLSREVVEMDAAIEKEEGMSIPRIFEKCGETYFRNAESRMLLKLQKTQRRIISCGGGIILRPENIIHMKESGHIVLLTATPETVFSRVKNSTDRPLLNTNMSVEHIAELMEKRRQKYDDAAELVVATDDKTISEICMEIKKGLGF